MLSRRKFIETSIAAAMVAQPLTAAGQTKLRKAVKIGMVEGRTLLDRFQLLKETGFEGVELNSPSEVSLQDAVSARDQTGIVIHGVVNGISWNPRLSDPDPAVRERALQNLLQALRDCRFVGGTTVLLVPGAVRDPQNENFDQVWERSTEQIRKAQRLAAELSVKIAIEVVWNDFITRPEQFVEFVDQFDPGAVGAYFDPSNVTKYGIPPATWIRQLGRRMLKFDFKGYHMQNGWVEIGQGSEDWPEIRKALAEVGYTGWATAEIKGGGRERLQVLSAQMDQVLFG
jgi:L-ribulose-5-phosphate 3-epimerase